MNAELLRYKSRFVTFVLLLGYAVLHMKLTGCYIDASLNEMADLSLRLPFAQRLLVPAMVYFLAPYAPVSTAQLFFLLEWLFISLAYFALLELLKFEFKARAAQLLAWLFILLLPLVSVVNYRLTLEGVASFFYPGDTASIFFVLLGFILCLKNQWRFFVPWVFLATLNRESSILLVLLIPALNWERLQTVFKPMFLSMFAYLLARCLVLYFVRALPGTVMEWYFRAGSHTYFEVNLWWLLEQQNFLFFIFCFAGLPLFWFAFYDYIPLRFRPLRYVLAFYFMGLLLVGNFSEARIFTEIMALAYFPVCVALSRWLTEQPPFSTGRSSGWLYFLDRYALIIGFGLIIVLRPYLIAPVVWLSRHV